MEDFLRDDLVSAFGSDNADKIQFSEVPKGSEGDMALRFFVLSKAMEQSPLELAKKAEESLKNNDKIAKMEASGPYLNLFFKDLALFEAAMAQKTNSELLKGEKIVLEYSGPNTNKPLHLGHMRNHALGLAMEQIYRANGAEVIPVNIINDRGIHICKSMWAYKHFGDEKTPESENMKGDHFVGKYYVKYSEEEKKNPEILKEVQAMLVDWEDGNDEVMTLWKKMNNWTLNGHKSTYERQKVEFKKAYKESDYYQEGKKIAEEGLAKNVFYKREDNAIMVDLESEKLDKKVVLRPDGTSIYLTQDLSVAVARIADYKPTKMVYVVADEQNYHFKVLFACLNRLKLTKEGQLTHLGYGLVNLPDGRMKSREGTVIDADDLMDKLSNLTKNHILERNPEIPDKEAHNIAEKIMNAAWKFTLLRTSTKKTITFDAEESMRFDGASGPYIQYSCVRILSLLSNYKGDLSTASLAFLGQEEKLLANKILGYKKVIEEAASKENPTYIVTYLLDLAQLWNSYYANTSILKAEKEVTEARLRFIKKLLAVFTHGLSLLSIEVPESM